MSVVYLTRKENFSASHRLHSAALSSEENRKLFGKCNFENGHGHNYSLEVTIRASVDKKTGLVMNLTGLKKIIEDAVISRVDHRHLNLDIPEFKDVNPTTENLCLVVWGWLQPCLPRDFLFEVKIFETEKNMAYYRGESK